MHLSDRAVDRLRGLDDWPDFAGTRYELLGPLGRGGMGTVFRGRDRELDRDVAIKVTTWATAADADRLRREARTLAALEHPGIVPIHDVGVLGDGRVFTVMMLVRGQRLDVAIADLPLRDRLRLFDRICDTVSFAHAGGVVHRDLKPANVMVGPFGRVFVLDWGLAAEGSGWCGTDGYRAPEQSTHTFDPRLDVYALGAILRDLVADEASPIVRPLRSVMTRAMNVDPGSRYATADDLAADVRRFLDGAAVGAHRETAIERTARLGRTYRMPIALILAYLAIRILFVVLSR
jgi:aminoglycoside phosphotransferase (APT) family kinase protein